MVGWLFCRSVAGTEVEEGSRSKSRRHGDLVSEEQLTFIRSLKKGYRKFVEEGR